MSARQGIFDNQQLVREQVVHGLLQHKTERTHVGLDAVGVVVINELHLVRAADMEIQSLQLPVHKGRQDVPVSGLFGQQGLCRIHQSGTIVH